MTCLTFSMLQFVKRIGRLQMWAFFLGTLTTMWALAAAGVCFLG
jgi:hypothetical protein